MEKINVTLAQLTPKCGDKQFNLKRIEEAMKKAHQQQSELIVFPELFLTGYSIGEELDKISETTKGISINKIKELAKQFSLYTVVGFPEKDMDKNKYISSMIISNKGEFLGNYRKTHLFDEEKNFFQPGQELQVISTPIGNIGLMICFDVEFPEVARSLKVMGADLLLIINANMKPYGEHHYIYAKSRAMENEIPVIICNRVGQEGELNFCGESMVINSWGTVLLAMNEEEEVSTIDLPLSSVTDLKMNYLERRNVKLYSNLIK